MKYFSHLPPSSHQLEPEVLNLMWDPFNLTMKSVISSSLSFSLSFSLGSLQFNHELGIVILISHCAIFIKMFPQDAKVDISLWGYRETSIEPELVSSQSLFFLILGIIFQRGIDVSIIC